MYRGEGRVNFGAALFMVSQTMKGMTETVKELIDGEALALPKSYEQEVVAFVHCFGINSIETSELSSDIKENLAAGLTGELAKIVGNGQETVETVDFLEHRLSFYRAAMIDGRGRDPLARLSLRFLQQFGADTPEYAAMIAALYFSLVQQANAVCGFLNGIEPRSAAM